MAMTTNKKRVVMYLDNADKQALEQYAKQQGRSMSSQARVSVMRDVKNSAVKSAMPTNK